MLMTFLSIFFVSLSILIIIIYLPQTLDITRDDDIQINETRDSSLALTKNVLIIRKSGHDNYTEYSCSVRNEFGEDSMIIRLEKRGKKLLTLLLLFSFGQNCAWLIVI